MARLNDYEKLMKLNYEIVKLCSCSSVLSYDSQVSMPSNGSNYRGELMEMLSMQIAKSMKSKDFLVLLDKVHSNKNLDDNQRLIVDDIHNDVKFSNRIPVKVHGKLAKMLATCNNEWERVKIDHVDDKKYLDSLTEYVALIKESINYANQGEYKTSYDYLLSDYSKGFDSVQIDTLFSSLKPFIDNALTQLGSTGEGTFDAPDHEVMKVCQQIAEKIIGQKDSFNLSKSTHPFCETLGLNDVRITTRIKPGNILDAIGSVVHESGHCAYELGLPSHHFGNVLGSAASIAAHEGISLFYEKHIGESEHMARYISSNFNYDYNEVMRWMRSINPENLIRTESDEITYQRHIINRFTIEKELFNGNLKVKDIPSRWNELYGKDLQPHEGYAVDVHWSNGLFGYFPSYTIGHLIAAQLKEAMQKDTILFGGSLHGSDNEVIMYSNIRNWLKLNYFNHGGKYGTNHLVEVATGNELNIDCWKRYITNKFSLK
jgi:carboxypeptidase Taq